MIMLYTRDVSTIVHLTDDEDGRWAQIRFTPSEKLQSYMLRLDCVRNTKSNHRIRGWNMFGPTIDRLWSICRDELTARIEAGRLLVKSYNNQRFHSLSSDGGEISDFFGYLRVATTIDIWLVDGMCPCEFHIRKGDRGLLREYAEAR